jgi:hypothetical protein
MEKSHEHAYNAYPEYLYGEVNSEKNVNHLQSEWKIDFPIEKIIQVMTTTLCLIG